MGLWTAKQIWASLPRDRRQAAALSLWEDENLTRVARGAALAPWLAARGIRPQFFEQMARTRRAQLMADGGMPEETASQALMSYHLAHQRALLGRFLDGLGIPHDNGLIKEDVHPEPPDETKVTSALESIRAEFPAADVDVYLRTLVATDPETWSAVVPLVGEPGA